MRIPSMDEVYDKAVLTKQLAALILVILFSVTSIFAQETNPKQLNWENPIVTVDDIQYELVSVDDWGIAEIKHVRFNKQGEIVETGTLVNNKPHGKWKSYDPRTGDVLATAYYYRGSRQKLEATAHDGKTYTVVYKNNSLLPDSQRIAYVQITGF